MVAAGLLEVKIALPLDHSGTRSTRARAALFHPKVGILYNGDGNVIAFNGSVNETGAAWMRNREEFDVKRSWFNPLDAEDIQLAEARFEMIWRAATPASWSCRCRRRCGSTSGVHAAGRPARPRPDAARRAPGRRPPRPHRRPVAAGRADEAGRRGAGARPRLGRRQTVRAVPAQARSAGRRSPFPASYLFCDEVGLGKTIEAGLVLRSLILKGELQRVLIVAPRGLIRQWMEELREKFALTAWFYDGHMLHDVGGRVRRRRTPGAKRASSSSVAH